MQDKTTVPTWLISLFLLFICPIQARPTSTERMYILPETVTGVKRPVLSLNGKWDFRFSPQHRWTSAEVPGELAMQGFAIEHDKPVTYRKTFNVPADFTGRRVVLRFDGVYSQARLTVNGTFVREHHGGFTRWETDITSLVRPGKRNTIVLEVTDRLDEISYASGYAHHPVGGILRDVTLFTLPENHLYNLSIETPFDSIYRDANLRLTAMASVKEGCEVELVLRDPQGKPVSLTQSRFALTEGRNVINPVVSNPQKWDAEHPNLYTLEATLYDKGTRISRLIRRIGFREVRIDGNRMLVNGSPVKLRGACRHDIHPTLGRTTTAELDSLDAILFKRANMNFVRTSHYPPNERFLDFCDRYGIYVECETGACFVNTYRQKNYAPGASQNDSTFTDRYVGQCREMVGSFRSHPSILFWSIGNESAYGSNFQQCWDWIKSNDTTRPVIFSYPGSSREQKAQIFDILSMHYQDVYGNVAQWGMSAHNFQGHNLPTLFDEWAHPACYTYATLQNDPNIREFWGKSLDMMWSGLFAATGGLGGAIWGYVDEVFHLPQPKTGTPYWKTFARTAKPEDYQGNCVGYGEWGIVDIWRREKPEFWSTKKAYSPVRLPDCDNLPFVTGQPLTLTVHNRFDHTDLDEIKATYTYKGQRKPLTLSPLAPHCKGILTVPAEAWEEGEPVLIEFFSQHNELIDAYKPVLGHERISYPELLPTGTLSCTENDSCVVVQGNGFEIPFDKQTGLISRATAGRRIWMEQGPYLNLYINYNHLSGAEVRKIANHYVTNTGDWKMTSFRHENQGQNVVVHMSGQYKDIRVNYRILITPRGEISIGYTTAGVPNGFLRETGLAFRLPAQWDSITWKRRGYWNYYPTGAFAGNEGRVSLYASKQAAYGQTPVQPWQDDTHDYYYWADAGANCKQPLTQAAKGMKENIYHYTLSSSDTEAHRLSVLSTDASVACRINKQDNGQLYLYANNRWDYPEIAWGNYCKKLEALPCYGQINLSIR